MSIRRREFSLPILLATFPVLRIAEGSTPHNKASCTKGWKSYYTTCEICVTSSPVLRAEVRRRREGPYAAVEEMACVKIVRLLSPRNLRQIEMSATL